MSAPSSSSVGPSPNLTMPPAFPTCMASAINDAYEITFVGIIEFLEKTLVDYYHVQQQGDGNDATTNGSSCYGTSAEHIAAMRREMSEKWQTPTSCSSDGYSTATMDDVAADDYCFAPSALEHVITNTGTLPILEEGRGQRCTIISPTDRQRPSDNSTAPQSFQTFSSPPPTQQQPKHDASLSRCHIGISFNAGKDSMVMLHLVLNAIERIVEVGDWVCGTYGNGRGGAVGGGGVSSDATSASPQTLIKARHIARFKLWRNVFLLSTEDQQQGGPSSCGLPSLHGLDCLRGHTATTPTTTTPNTTTIHSPCHSPLLAYLYSHLCIFYFEDKDEIPQMKAFLECLMGGLDLPIYAMSIDGGLAKVGPAGEAVGEGDAEEQTTTTSVTATGGIVPVLTPITAVNEAVLASTNGVTASTSSYCQRFHSRHHHVGCPLHVNNGARVSSGTVTPAPASLAGDEVGSEASRTLATPTAAGSPTSTRSYPPAMHGRFRGPNIVAGSENLIASHSLHHHTSSASASSPSVYRGAKVIRVCEGAGMIDGLRLLKEHLHVHFAFLGVRCEDVVGWRQDPVELTSKGWPLLLRLCPIFRWTYQQVWMYMFLYGVPFCELYAMGISSCGPAARTVRNPSCFVVVDEADVERRAETLGLLGGSGNNTISPIEATFEATVKPLHAANCYDPTHNDGHRVHPNDPSAVLVAPASGSDVASSSTVSTAGTTTSSSPLSSYGNGSITINQMWPSIVVAKCAEATRREGGNGMEASSEEVQQTTAITTKSLPRKPSEATYLNAAGVCAITSKRASMCPVDGHCDTLEGFNATMAPDLYTCWRRWWEAKTGVADPPTCSHSKGQHTMGGGALPAIVTALWDPTEVDLNATQLGNGLLAVGGPADPISNPYLASFCEAEGVVGPTATTTTNTTSSPPRHVPYCLPAWLLKDGTLERASRLPAPPKKKVVAAADATPDTATTNSPSKI